MRTPHPSLGALSGSWCPDVSSVFIARIGASATIERLHAKSIQKSDLPVIFLSLLIGQTPLRIWCCFEESIAVEEREKGTLEYCLIILLLSNIPDVFLHGFFLLVCHSVRFSCHCSPHLTLVAAFRSPLLLDVAATEDGRAHVITDGLAGIEQEMIPLLGFLAKSQREAEFPIAILMRPGRHGVHLESAGRRRLFLND